jgi:hypothetical protein
MNTIRIFVVLAFVCSVGYAGGDSIFVKIQGDTTTIWHKNAESNCATKFTFDVTVANDTIVVVERDTSKHHATCTCIFDLNVAIRNLAIGNYYVMVYRQLLKAYGYSIDTTYFIGSTSFTVTGTNLLPYFSFNSFQSGCGGIPTQIRMTAKSVKAIADSLAITYASNAKLAQVTCSEIDTSGKSMVWSYVYFSFDTITPLNSKKYYFLAQDNHVTFDRSEVLGVGPAILIDRWMDSDSALLVAQRAGGSDIRRRFPACTIMASLWRRPSPPFINEWQLDYKCSDSTRTLYLNAASGEVITSVKETGNPALSNQFELHQNYPNPFNSATVISYKLSVKSFVNLKIYDLLGRDVATLVIGIQDAGVQKIDWNGRVASGMYYYRIDAVSMSDPNNRFIQVRKMLLLK